jgi:leucyl-tRNA synthetase
MAAMDFKSVQDKWQKAWEDAKVFHSQEDALDANGMKRKKFYMLEMYPYPSGSGLHMGHARNYTLGDAFSRYKRMQGFNVLYPMGYDSFGLPAENAAIKAKSHPRIYTDTAVKNFVKQQKALGLSYDWTRMIASHTEEYYVWDQWIFLQLFKKGLAYKKTSMVNWCSQCETVLANEQVVNGCCWRHEETPVETKELNQWFIKTTAYADQLLDGLDNLDWPEDVKQMQRNWIGKSFGTLLHFDVVDEHGKKVDSISTFTTRPDTAYGITYLVLAVEHPKVKEWTKGTAIEKDVARFVADVQKRSLIERTAEGKEKNGMFLGKYFINPFTKEKLPLWIADYALLEYGTGAVMAVPAHDQRDFEFARKYGLPIREVILPVYGEAHQGAVTRQTITAVVHRKSDDKFLYVKWKEYGWIAPCIGGIDSGESPLHAAEREVFEETGYKTKAIKKLGGQVIMNFYAENKKEHRHRIDQPILLELIEDIPCHISEEESSRQSPIWLTVTEAKKMTTHEYNNTGLLRYLGEDAASTGEGILINSREFDNCSNKDAMEKISAFAEINGWGKKTVNYKLRDWLISRQRYWGCPIPMLYCDKCGIVPVPERQLPITLPDDVSFGHGNPLATSTSFQNATCPICLGPARRETDTMDTFIDSSWYFMRYCDAKNSHKPFDKEKVNYWLPIDLYIGGKEHATGHLIYFRFLTKFLKDLGMHDIDEPAQRLFNQGMLHKGGVVMSKSKGNVVLPEEVSDQYGIDTARFFLLFVAGPDKDMEWSDQGVDGAHRFIKRFITLISREHHDKADAKEVSRLHRTIRDVTAYYERLEYNKALIEIMKFANYLADKESSSKKSAEALVLLLAPICPHIGEELWEGLGHKQFVSTTTWPSFDEKKINLELEAEDDFVEKVREDLLALKKLIKFEPKKLTLIISQEWKYAFFATLKTEMEKTRDMKSLITACMIKGHEKDIAPMVASVLKDPAKMPAFVLSQDKEMRALKDAAKKLSEEFGLDMHVEKAENSKEAKAGAALPGKPAIVAA